MAKRQIDFGILGTLEVRRDGVPVALKGAKQRALLAILLLRANEIVSVDTLVDELWGERPPDTAANAVQVYVSQLRKALAAGAANGILVTRAPGYVLEVERGQLDLHRFEHLVEEGRAALARDEPEVAGETLRAALALWRGQPLAEFVDEPFARTEILRLEELRLAALEDRIEADLALGGERELVPELEALVAEHPLRERLRAQLMLALYRSGRQADALEQYREARRTLVDELGIEPGPELQRLEKAVLAQDEALDAPAAAAPAAAAELPTPPTPLVGRAREVAEATELLRGDDVRLLTLTGPGGIGKTRLALAIAHELAGSYPDGAVFVPLAAITDATLVGPTIAKALGVSGGAAADDALGRALAKRRLLLVLDNFEQVLPAAPLLGELLASAPGLELLVTSRAVLRISGEHEYTVPPLAASESVALFLQRARASGGDFELTDEDGIAVTEICERLDGLPLAIELAAARTRLLAPAAILERLASRLGLLTSGARDAPARQRTLRTAIDWSYNLLEDSERRLFAQLGVFVGGAALEAIEDVCGDGSPTLLDDLASLVDKSLVRRRSGANTRFGMLETIREYALERLSDSGEQIELRDRHRAYYLRVAEAADLSLTGAEQGEWLQRLEEDHDNFRAAFAHAVETGDPVSALRLGAALRRFWQIHGHLAEGRRALETALRHAPPGLAPEVRIKVANTAGILAGEQGDFETARGYFEEGLAIARERDDAYYVAATLTNLGNLALFQADYATASRLYEEALERSRTAGLDRGLAVTIENLGCVALLEGDVERSIELLSESEALMRATSDLHNLASTLRALGRSHLERGDRERADELFRESLELALEIGQRHGIADCLEGLAAFAVARGDAARAAALFGAAEALRESFGAKRAPDVEAWHVRWSARAHEALDPAAFDAEEARGRRLSLDDAVRLATER